jgi:hypothetical protein
MNVHDMQHDRAAAQQIIKALALPALSRASEPPRPVPLGHLPRLPRETSMLFFSAWRWIEASTTWLSHASLVLFR